MKLFIRADPYRVPYGGSMVFAVAETVEQAKIEVARAKAYSYCKFEADSSFVASSATKLEEPTRIVDLPCAEWHHWSE